MSHSSFFRSHPKKNQQEDKNQSAIKLLVRSLAVAGIGLAVGNWAMALKPVRITPQGEVSRVREFVVQFDQAAVTAGNPNASAPYTIQCQGGGQTEIPKHHGSWVNASTWKASFEDVLPPDVSCTATSTAGFKSPKGETLHASKVQFRTGAPFAQWISPSYGPIAEDQAFLLRFNGSVDAASLQAQAFCGIEGIGEKTPVQLITGDDREAILQSQGKYTYEAAKKNPNHFALLRCNRTLPPNAKVDIALGQYKGTSGSTNNNPQSWQFVVRSPLEANLSCERSHAQAGCMPIRPLSVNFSAPIPMQWARQMTVQTPQGTTLKPQFTPEEEKANSAVQIVKFAGALPEQAELKVIMPDGLQDESGRPLSNAHSFPLSVRTGPMPALLKFAAAPFGIIERYAEGKKAPAALLPVTVRKVENDLQIKGLQPTQSGATVRDFSPKSDAEIIQWLQRVDEFDSGYIRRETAIKEHGIKNLPLPMPKPENDDEESYVPDDMVETRMLSLLEGTDAKTLTLPKTDSQDGRPFEVIGIPLQTGFHVVEATSPLLGQSLLSTKHRSPRVMYVRTSVLVTNLSVHFKRGRTDAFVWVTSLDTGKPVANADVAISSGKGKLLASGKTDANGMWHHPQPLPRDSYDDEQVFVSARTQSTDGKTESDMAFVWSNWDRGIESWRFNVPTDSSTTLDSAAHSVLDRSLLRAGETVSMKHIFRQATPTGLSAATEHPATLRITHAGSDDSIDMPLNWRRNATGGHTAESQWAIPKEAKLGVYQLYLVGKNKRGEEETYASGNFRVEEFRLPTMQGSITPVEKAPLIGVTDLPVQVQLAYINGGAANGLPVAVSASVRERDVYFSDYSEFSFTRRQRNPNGDDDNDSWRYESEDEDSASVQRLLADRLPLKLGADGTGQLTISGVRKSALPQDITLEASYSDPNGEIQTLQSRQRVWPANVIVGIKADGWISVKDTTRLQALALGVDGKPKSGVKMQVRAILHSTVSTRKRLVGGFYAYDNEKSSKDLGTVCTGTSDSRGLLLCNTDIKETGEVELIVSATDEAGRQTEAATDVHIVRAEELWFGGNDTDRMDVLPEKRDYQPGETAKLQVRMPFRQATALLTVEREGILHSEVVQLRGTDPTISLKIKPEWGPNVYVNVLALRGRLREVPWYSFFTWGIFSPIEWWNAYKEASKDYTPPTSTIDLSKPAFRIGMAPINVGLQGHSLQIQVQADKDSYQVRQQAQVTIEAKLPNGQPAANAEVALAAVDEALLELKPNTSWNVLNAMFATRPWGVETATAQMEIVGRRHYGRKAVPAGGDGGQGSNTRELLDTLLLWNPHVQLDANGRAQVTVPLNDALTSFRIVAVGTSGQDLFGTGHTQVRTTQDLQIISGLPPLVREGDQFQAQITLRNTTKKDMQVQVKPQATGIELAAQTVAIAAGGSQEISWNVTAPVQQAFAPEQQIDWEITAQDTAGSKAQDALKVSQRIVPAVPVTVQQATLVQVSGNVNMDWAAPPQSLSVLNGKNARGGISVALQPTLAEGLPGVRDWFSNYTYTCLEQRSSKSIGMRDIAMWEDIMTNLPNYLDADGLASYFPPQKGSAARGSDTLTAYLLAVTHEAAALDKRWALPEGVRNQMMSGLSKFAEGKIERRFWSPKADRDVRKLAAIEALARYGKARADMLTSIEITPNLWPTNAVIDWYSILKQMPQAPQRAERMREAEQILRSRLNVHGTRMVFSTEENDYWWWLMHNGDVNSARLILTMLDNPAWQNDMGQLASGFIARQKNGAWHTTNANLWGGLALEKFAAKFEKDPVAGTTTIALGQAKEQIDWSKVSRLPAQAQTLPSKRLGAPAFAGMYTNNSAMLPWQAAAGQAQLLRISQQGSGKPWATVQALAAVPLKAPQVAGYSVKKTITPVQEAVAGKVSRGDVWRVRLEINASTPMTWVAVSDPVAGGATILGSGLGRDSAIATEGERNEGAGWLAFVERSFEAYHAYYEYLPAGKTTLEYTVRLNNVGHFNLPPTRVEALYAPEIFGATPNAAVQVGAKP